MKRLHKFCCLPSPYRHLLVKSVLLLGFIRVGLWLLPFQTLRRLLAHWGRSHAELEGEDQASMQQVVWAVTLASRYVPATTCLAQALVTQVLLGQRGHPALDIEALPRQARRFHIVHHGDVPRPGFGELGPDRFGQREAREALAQLAEGLRAEAEILDGRQLLVQIAAVSPNGERLASASASSKPGTRYREATGPKSSIVEVSSSGSGDSMRVGAMKNPRS